MHLLTNGPPVYEVNENLPAKTLVIKFQNARLDFVDGRNERLFNDEQVAGIRFNKVDDAIWAQFKLRLSELSYEIVPRTEGDGIAIVSVSYTHLRAHETKANLVCRSRMPSSA